jgi:cytochrome b561
VLTKAAMSLTKRPPHVYHWCQITLHWLVALLVAAQYATGGSIERTHHAVAHGLEAQPFDLLLHKIHNRTGLIILALMLVRLAMRLSIGVPDQLGSRSDWHVRVARAAHLSFYVILIAQASTGAIASYFFWPISVVHVALSKVLLALIALHAAAAFWHFFIVRDAAMERMLTLRASRASIASAPALSEPHGR